MAPQSNAVLPLLSLQRWSVAFFLVFPQCYRIIRVEADALHLIVWYPTSRRPQPTNPIPTRAYYRCAIIHTSHHLAKPNPTGYANKEEEKKEKNTNPSLPFPSVDGNPIVSWNSDSGLATVKYHDHSGKCTHNNTGYSYLLTIWAIKTSRTKPTDSSGTPDVTLHHSIRWRIHSSLLV